MSDTLWKTAALSKLVDVNPETLGATTPPDFHFRYIDITSVTSGRVNWPTIVEYEFRRAPSRARRIVRPGDTLFCTVRPILQAHASADWAERDGYVCSTGFAVLRPRQLHPRFLFHTVFSEPVVSYVRQREVGSNYPAVNESDLELMQLCVPESRVEQARIAEILDTLDAAILETEAVVSKLRQVKAGLLHDLLTRGLDETGFPRDPAHHPEQFQGAPMALIPVTWQAMKLNELTIKIVDGVHKTPRYQRAGIPFLTVEDLTRASQIAFSTGRFVSVEDHRTFCKRADPRKGDLLVTKDGTLGIARVVPDDAPEFSIFVSVALLRPDPEHTTAEFLKLFFESHDFERQLATLSAGTGLKHIHLEHFREFLVLTPPLPEQQEIVRVHAIQVERLAQEEKHLAKLRLVKHGLSADLLTGRVRVKI